jgi:FkbM family methyltransferase
MIYFRPKRSINIPREAVRFAKTIRSFGALRGALAYYYYVKYRLVKDDRHIMKSIKIPGFAHPIWLRPGTSDWLVMEQILVDEEYKFSDWPEHEQFLFDRYQDALNRSRKCLIIDCGANIGLSSIWFAKKFPQAHIFAVEPEPSNFEILKRNASDYSTILPIHAAIYDRITRVSLSNSGAQPWSWQTKEHVPNSSTSVETVTISELLAHYADAVPIIIKIDIEGAEVDLFRSKTEWVRQTPLVVFELHDFLGGWRGTGHAVFSCLTSHRRDYLRRGENIFSFSHPENHLSGPTVD